MILYSLLISKYFVSLRNSGINKDSSSTISNIDIFLRDEYYSIPKGDYIFLWKWSGYANWDNAERFEFSVKTITPIISNVQYKNALNPNIKSDTELGKIPP